MFWMFKKVNTREDIVGFYSTGPKLKENDLKISSLIKQFCTVTHEPVFIIIDIRPGISGLPTTAYEAVEEVVSHGKEFQRVFKHIPCSIGAEEAEEVGVEHLLRDINDPSTSSLALQISEKISGLTGLAKRLTEIKEYLDRVTRPEGDPKKLPVNNQIIYNLQNILNLLPNLNVEELVRSMQIKTNDMHLIMYLSSLIRSVIALHSLLQNKIKFADMDERIEADDEKNAKSKEKKEEKEGEEKAESAKQ
jgi:26S proteasome regulatory subunit N8